MASGAGSVHAGAKPRWADTPYKYIIIDQDIRDVLTEFGQNLKIPVKISETLAGRRIRGGMDGTSDRSAQDFLQTLCDSYGCVWYFDGTFLHISGQNEVGTELVELNRLRPEDALRQLGDLQLNDPRFSVRVTDDGRMLLVAGPPAYRSAVRRRASGLRSDAKGASETRMKESPEVQVFRGGS
jgi:type III secretion protein C